MKTIWMPLAAIIVAALGAPARALPSTITYQGSLKQNGVPVTGSPVIELRITNHDGSQAYWSSGPRAVEVREGLYRVEIAPTNIDWARWDLFLETRVDGTLLLPREKFNAVPHALAAGEALRLSSGAVAAGGLWVMSTSTAASAPPAMDVQGAYVRVGDHQGAQTYPGGMGIKFHDTGAQNAALQYKSDGGVMLFGLSASSNGVQVSTPTLVIDMANQRVGVSTGAPTVALDVNGAARFGRSVGINAPAGAAPLVIRSTGTGLQPVLQFSGPGGTPAWRVQFNDSDKSMRLGSDDPYQNMYVETKYVHFNGRLVDESGKPAFFVNVVGDDCGWSRPYMGCPSGYQIVGQWHTGPGRCDGSAEGHGTYNGAVDSGWMGLCFAY